jgi:hypothetical protein
MFRRKYLFLFSALSSNFLTFLLLSNRFKERERIKEERLFRWQKDMERKRLDRAIRADQRERARYARLLTIKQREVEVRAQKVHFIEAKEKAALIRQSHDSGVLSARREQQVQCRDIVCPCLKGMGQ